MIEKLDALIEEFDHALGEARSAADVANVKAQFLGKKGVLASMVDLSCVALYYLEAGLIPSWFPQRRKLNA